MVAWIKHDKPARLEYMPKLMEHVRLPLLSRDYLVQVMYLFFLFLYFYYSHKYSTFCITKFLKM